MRRTTRPRLALCALESRVNPGNLTLTNALIVDASNNPQPNPVVGENIFLRAEWLTTGLSSSDQYVVRYTVDGLPADSGVLAGQAGTNLSYSWYRNGWWLGPGSHTIVVTVDGANQIGESNESDNTITFNVTPVEPTSLPQKFAIPLGGVPFGDWSIVNYADVDPRSGSTADFRGGPFQYDGHDAWDVTLPNFTQMDAGTPDIAAADGVVSQVVDGNFDRETAGNNNQGNYVMVDHGNGWSTLYYHLMKGSITVKVGDPVTRGQVLGFAGSSGSSSDAHLHFTPYYNGCQVETMFDPAAYWLDPPQYQGDRPTTVTDAGITNENPFSDLKERPPEVDTFPTSTSWDVWFWYRASHFNVGDSVNINWYEPGGGLYTTYTYTPTTTDRYAGHGWVLPVSSWSTQAGVWQVALEVNGVELTRQSFTVTNGAGDSAIRLTQGSTYVIDGRTTPMDFGTVSSGSNPPQQSYTVQNIGSSPLTLSGLTLPPNFSLVGSLPASIAAGGSSTFILRMNTNAVGGQRGEVRFTTNDPNHPSFHFAVSGTVTGTVAFGSPVLTLGSSACGYTLGPPPVPLDPTATLTDSDSANFNTGSLKVEFAFGGTADDGLGILNIGSGTGQIGVSGSTVKYEGTTIGTFAGGTAGSPLVVSLNASATLAAVQALLQDITFVDNNTAAPTNPRVVRFTLIDDAGIVSNLAIKAVTPYPSMGPLVTSVGPVTPNPRSVAVDTIDVTFSQPLLAGTFDRADLTLTRDGGSNLIDAGVSVALQSGNTYRVSGLTLLTQVAGDYTLTVSADAISDAGGYPGFGSGSTSWTMQTTAPTVTINQGATQSDPTNSSGIKFDVQFSETVIGFTGSDISFAGSTVGGTLSASVATGIAPNSYVVTVSGMTTSGDVVASIPAGVAQDLALNGNAASTSTDNTVTFDNVRPTLTITPNPAGTVGGNSVTFDVLFSETVNGFDSSKVDLTGTTAPGATATVSGTGPAYTVTISGMTAGGTIATRINNGVVTDLAGNTNQPAGPASVSYINSGTVQFSAPEYSIDEQGSPILTVTVTRTGGAEGPLSVNYSTVDGTAVLGSDYGAPSGTGTLSWGDGIADDQTFTIPIIDNGSFHPDTAFTVILTGANVTGSIGTPAAATVDILEPAAIRFDASNYTVNEGDGTVTFHVKRLFGSHGAVSVHYATADGSATLLDYSSASGTLNWDDGETTDKSFTVSIADDPVNEGDETFSLNLDTVTGRAAIWPAATSTVTIARSDGVTVHGTISKAEATIIDKDNDVVTLRLGGKVGTLKYYLTNGSGPISAIELAGTNPAKSTLSLAVRTPRGSGGNGHTSIGEITGSGLKTLSLAKADLDGPGIDLNGYLGSLTISDVKNGADIAVSGAPPVAKAATRITAGVIEDGTDINITGVPLSSLTAVSVGTGTITAPSVGSITVKGKAKTKTAVAIPGDFKSDLTILGTGLPAKTAALKSLRVAGAISGSTIVVGSGLGTIGDVARVSAASFVNSRLFAGYSGPDDGTGAFNPPSTVSSFTVTGKTLAFAHSFVIAANFKNVSLASVDTDNGSTKFGFFFSSTVGRLTVRNPAFRFDPLGANELGADFVVKKV